MSKNVVYSRIEMIISVPKYNIWALNKHKQNGFSEDWVNELQKKSTFLAIF